MDMRDSMAALRKKYKGSSSPSESGDEDDGNNDQ
jgi:hypothetical protein